MGKRGTATEMVTGSAPTLDIHGRHIDLSEKFKEHVKEKLARVDRFGVVIMSIDVEVTFERHARQAEQSFEVELTCRGRDLVIRAEAQAPEKWAALDIAYERLSERLRRAADRRHDRQRGKLRQKATAPTVDAPPPAELSELTEIVEHEPDVVYSQGPVEVREKQHSSRPMTIAEAVDAMELVGHSFYLFQDKESGLASVVYHRRGYEYGVIRLTADE